MELRNHDIPRFYSGKIIIGSENGEIKAHQYQHYLTNYYGVRMTLDPKVRITEYRNRKFYNEEVVVYDENNDYFGGEMETLLCAAVQTPCTGTFLTTCKELQSKIEPFCANDKNYDSIINE